MGNAAIKYICFEDVQQAMRDTFNATIINTLPISEQDCLIYATILGPNEETKINELLATNKHKKIVVYGRNCTDTSVVKKATQLQTLGFNDVCVYGGGLFEWLLLQDIYGKDEFRTTSNTKITNNKCFDILKYK